MKNIGKYLLFPCLVASLRAQSPQIISAGRAVELDLKGVSSEESARFHGVYPVSDSGTVNLPNLSSPVRAAGLTASQLSGAIEAAYRSAGIYKDPKVQVIASTTERGAEELVLTIGGQVKRPGPVKFNPGMTLYQALQAGGGATEFGSMKRVNLIREGKARTIDLTKNEDKNLPAKPNDTLEVPQKTLTGG
ncbi:MAG: putative polysaccharide export protein [Akkermansiaceae bacterium]|nr:putative polysaccharide export protein [Akkermansiaceae bacterium]